jgi:hypothetical protein
MRYLLVALVCAVLALGQIGTSTITGRVTDPSGAVMAGVQATVVHVDTNFTFNATTNAEGLFRVQSLQPGRYRVTFEAAGFKRLVRDDVELRTGDTLAVDATLQVGQVTESVEVVGATPLLETETSATGTVVSGDVLYRLPLYQRYINSTLNLVPGMTTQGYAYGGSLGSYHLAGQRNGSIGIFEDGVNGNDQLGGTGTIKPIQNAVAEVKVLTTTLPAEYGHSAGGVISVVKKSGTNEFHGLASLFGRSRSMQHRLFFDKERTSQKTPLQPNGVPTFFLQPDFNGGGPVYIPKVYDGRNKTFWFFGYQKLIEKKIAQVVTTVPTAEMMAGDFNFPGVANPNRIFDPATTRNQPGVGWVRDQFPGNRIPLSRFDPVARNVLSHNPWQRPNLTASFNANGPSSNYLANEYALVYFDDYSFRADHQFSPNFKVYGSYTYNFTSGLGRPWNVANIDFDGVAGINTPFRQHNYSAGKTWVIGPTLINDARVGFFRRINQRFVHNENENWGQQLGIPGISPRLMPGFGSGDRNGPDSIYGLSGNNPFKEISETVSFRNDTTKIVGTHAFKFGYEILRYRLNFTNVGRVSGQFFFNGMTAGLQPDGLGNLTPGTGNTFAGFLTGYVRQAQFDGELASWLPRSSIHSFYIQDDWKVTPTLTANLGVRYSNESPFRTKYGQMTNFDPAATDDILRGATGAFVHPTSALNKRDNNNFQPRVGLAWHPWQKWVFRGGFAVNTIDVKYPASRGQFEEYTALANLQRDPGDPRAIFRISEGPGNVSFNIRPNGTSGFVGTNFGSRSADWWDPALRNAYALNWNGTIQYEFNRNHLLEVSYQGSAGVGLIERWNINTFPLDFGKGDLAFQNRVLAQAQNFRPYPHFGDVRLRSNHGHSTFHSGTVRLERRLAQGLYFNTFYTFSKTLDSQDFDNDGSGVAPIQNKGLEKGRAIFDRNHRYIGVVTWELPMGNGKRFLNRGGWWHRVFGGYEIAWIQTIESGNPLTFTFANSPFNYYPTFVGNRRPDLVSRPRLRDNWGDLGGDRFNQLNSNPIIDINHFAYPAAFTPGNSGRGILTGTRLLWSQVSASKDIQIGERLNFQIRWDFQNAFHNYNFNPPTNTVDFRNPNAFGKLTADQRTASLGGQALMNLTLQLTF